MTPELARVPLHFRVPGARCGPFTLQLVVGGPGEYPVGGALENGEHPPRFVAGVDSLPLNALPSQVIALFGHADFRGLHDCLCRTYGTGFPEDVRVTLYTLVESPPEEWEIVENVSKSTVSTDRSEWLGSPREGHAL